jgi:hypothetical protein
MVHGELIKAGAVEKLSFRQLERLEKIDAQKARRQARDLRKLEREKTFSQATIGSATAAIYSFGKIADTALEGVFKIGAAAAGAGPISQGIDALAAAIIVTWINANYPGLAHFFHLDTFPGFPGAMLQPAPPGTAAGTPATGQPAGPGQPPANYVIVPTGVNVYSLPKSILQQATNKAISGDTLGCVSTLTQAGADNQTAVVYCSNTTQGVGQF